MAVRTEQVEQIAHKIWSNRTGRDCDRIEKQCGASQLGWLEWDALPEKVRDYMRDMAEEKVAYMQTLPPLSEIERYLISLFRELERLRPTHYGAISHGIAWDSDWERLILLINRGDAASLHPLNPGDLTSDPAVTAASLAGKVEPELDNPDINMISIKR
jgi:hypothetical protein